MRKIKFRGWNILTQTMIDLKKITPLAVSPGLDCDGLFLPFTDDIQLMQFTGLHDKDGKEIYEGDIIVHDENESDMIGKVIFYPSFGWSGYWKYRYPADGQRTDFFSTGTIARHSFEDGKWYWRTDVQVIGNIYETPELLEAK